MGLFGGSQNNQINSRLLGYRVSTSVSGTALPIVFGTNRLPGNVIWTGDWQANNASGKAGKGKYGGNYVYQTAGIVAICSGPVTALLNIWQNQLKNGTTTNFLNATSASSLNLTVFDGGLGQSPWTYLTSHHADQAIGYSGVVYVANDKWDLGSSGMFPNYSYEIQGLNVFGGVVADADCSAVINTILTDTELGAGFGSGEVDISEMQAYTQANSIFVSPVLDKQRAASEWIDELLKIANAEAVWSEGVIKFRSRGDSTITNNGATFTPTTTPVANLTDDDFMDRTEPVRINRPDPRSAYNAVTVNWTNRANQYNTEPYQEQDQGAIDQYGYRPASALDALGICTPDVAAKTAHIQLKRNLYNRTKYKFSLGWNWIMLEPMDVVTLTCTVGTQNFQKLNQTPVRITNIQEDQDGYLSVDAEEIPLGVGTPVQHVSQTGGGAAPAVNAAPGSVNAPVFYEAAYQMRQALYSTQYALLIAVSGGPYWGGATVHQSWDGSSYNIVGRQVGATPMGTLTATLNTGSDPDNTNTLSVNLLESFGQLSTVTKADADNFKTLSVLGNGTTAELVSYETATLTGTNAYDLTYLRRGVYGSTIASHASASSYFLAQNAFVWIYTAQDIGKTVHFKFTSFNQYGRAEEDLGSVTDYTYTLTGGLSDVKVVTSDYTIQPGDPAVNADTTGGPITITLPDPSTVVNTTVVITNVGTGVLTIAGGGSGVGDTSLTRQWQSVTLEATPSGWIEISSTSGGVLFKEPLGIPDNVTKTFAISHTPKGAVMVYLNGDEQTEGRWATVNGQIVTFNVAPLDIDFIDAEYEY
jgi:hypothetical protein